MVITGIVRIIVESLRNVDRKPLALPKNDDRFLLFRLPCHAGDDNNLVIIQLILLRCTLDDQEPRFIFRDIFIDLVEHDGQEEQVDL